MKKSDKNIVRYAKTNCFGMASALWNVWASSSHDLPVTDFVHYVRNKKRIPARFCFYIYTDQPNDFRTGHAFVLNYDRKWELYQSFEGYFQLSCIAIDESHLAVSFLSVLESFIENKRVDSPILLRTLTSFLQLKCLWSPSHIADITIKTNVPTLHCQFGPISRPLALPKRYSTLSNISRDYNISISDLFKNSFLYWKRFFCS
jgi:hypothetical protein